MQLPIVLGHFEPTYNVSSNLVKIKEILHSAECGDIIVLPEGGLSGYDDDIPFLSYEFAEEIDRGIEELLDLVQELSVHLMIGSLLYREGKWYNAALYLSPSGELYTYFKVNLAYHERTKLTPGDELKPFDMIYKGERVSCAFQICREIRFPEQWKYLSLQGAQVIFYLTNMTFAEQKPVWNSHLISRAAENQRFIVSSNTSHMNQGCSTMIVSPKGQVMEELPVRVETFKRVEIDLSQTSDWYLGQSRVDVVAIEGNGCSRVEEEELEHTIRE